MQYRKLGRSELNVSEICLGTMTWGEQNTEQEAHQQLDTAINAGINFIDTAEMYPIPPKSATATLTEEYIGRWLKKHNNRAKLVLATKVASRADWISHIREGKTCLNQQNITSALHDSLARLQTDYIDLYQLHWPDRNTNFFGKLGYQHQPDENTIPLQETLEVLNKFVAEGKIRYIGLSNETPWGVMTFLQIAEQYGLAKVVSIQNPYNLLNRTYEIGLAEISEREKLGLLSYSPLAFGVLTGKYLADACLAGARLTLFKSYNRYSNDNATKATQKYVELAQFHGLAPAHLALAYIHSRSFVASTIIGATNIDQLKQDITSIDIVLSKDALAAIEDIHQQYSNPCP